VVAVTHSDIFTAGPAATKLAAGAPSQVAPAEKNAVIFACASEIAPNVVNARMAIAVTTALMRKTLNHFD